MTKTPVSVIGLGRMGATIAEIYLREGHPTTVWNRTPTKAEPLLAKGARRATTVAEAVAASPVAVIMLADDGVVRASLESATSELDGRTVVNLTTGRPDEARELGDWLAGHGADYLDGGVLGVPQTLATPESVIIYSGSAAANQRHGDIVAALGTARYLGADHGLASLNDMAILSGMYGLFSGYFHSVAMVDSEGFKAGEFTRELLIPWLRSIIDMLPTLAEEIDSGDYPVNFSNLDVNVAGIENIMRTSRSQGVTDAPLVPLRDALAAQRAKGHGEASFSRAVVELKSSE